MIVEPNSIQAIMSGSGKEYGKIDFISKKKEMNEGSVVYTSGSGGLFKEGVPVGKLINQK